MKAIIDAPSTRALPPRVHISEHGMVGAVFIGVEAEDSDDCRGGRLSLTLAAARALPRAIEAALADYDARHRAAA